MKVFHKQIKGYLFKMLMLISVVKADGDDQQTTDASQMYSYDNIDDGLPPPETSNPDPIAATDVAVVTQPPATTLAPAYDNVVLGSATSVTTVNQTQFQGSDEMKVFFRDCRPYKKDTLFGGPVCASNKRTYPNFMYMECLNYRISKQERVRVLHEGPCWANPPGGGCPIDPIYEPVCGSDNETYANRRALECEARKPNKTSLEIKYRGECIGNGFCYFSNYTWDRPVCASSGRTLQSYQAVKCLRSLDSGVELLHDGHCTADDLKSSLKLRSKICRRLRHEVEPFPVCANDGQTYPSAAYVICNKPHLEVEFDGPCSSSKCRACTVAKKMDQENKCSPVCGSDGKNYNSEHHLFCARSVKTYLSFLHKGQCEALDSPCAKIFMLKAKQSPVCASDGVTYISPLAMECVARYKKNGIEFRHMGPCLKNY